MNPRLYVMSDALLWQTLQKDGFADVYAAYRDDATSPYTEDISRIEHRMRDPKTVHYLIYDGKVNVGAFRIKYVADNTLKLGSLFILPPYRNKGYASAVLSQIEKRYSRAVSAIVLDTIAEEKRNVHLYEKCGFLRDASSDREISSAMHLIGFKKIIGKQSPSS